MRAFFYIFCGLWVGLLAGCSNDKRSNTKIPPLPNFDDKARISRSIDFLTDAISKSPRAAASYQKRAELYVEQNKWSDALNDINKALEISPGNGAFLLTRAKVNRQLKRYDQALLDARQAEVSNQNSPELFTVLGDLMQRNKRYDQGKLYLTKALQMAPYNGEPYYYDGLIEAKRGDTIQAISLMEQALSLKPRFLDAYVSLTEIYTQLEDYQTAMQFNKRGTRYFPKNASLFLVKGALYQSQRKLDSALYSYQRVINLEPSNTRAHYEMGIICLYRRNFPAAVKHFGQVAQINSNYSRIHALLGIAFDKSGNIKRAAEEYALAVKESPYDYKIKNALARMVYKQQYFDKYGFYPVFRTQNTEDSTATDEDAIEEPQKALDTNRIKITELKPRLELKTKKDSTTSTIKLKQ